MLYCHYSLKLQSDCINFFPHSYIVGLQPILCCRRSLSEKWYSRTVITRNNVLSAWQNKKVLFQICCKNWRCRKEDWGLSICFVPFLLLHTVSCNVPLIWHQLKRCCSSECLNSCNWVSKVSETINNDKIQNHKKWRIVSRFFLTFFFFLNMCNT